MKKGKPVKKKKLYKIIVTETCRMGDQPIEYWTWAYSSKQAKRNVRIKYNKEHKRLLNTYVKMYIEYAKEQKLLNNEAGE